MTKYTMAVKNDDSSRITKRNVTDLTRGQQRKAAQAMANELQCNVSLEWWTTKRLTHSTSTTLLKLFRPEGEV